MISIVKRIIIIVFFFELKYVDVKGSKIYYIDEGKGVLMLFIYGNFIFFYLWCNIIFYFINYVRCIVFDYIGMGKFDKLDIDYGFEDFFFYLEVFIEKLGLQDIILVIYDWGGIMGFYYVNIY